MAKVGGVTVSFDAGTSQFLLDAGKVKTSLKEVGQAGTSAGREATLAMKDLGHGITDNSRAAAAFAVNVLRLGPLLKVAFPLLGGLAFSAMLVDLGKNVYNFFKELREGPEKARGAWGELNNSIRLSNAELELSNAKLDQQISKLEGHRQDGLAISLAEARVEAGKLSQQLERTLNDAYNLFKGQEPSFLQALFGKISNKAIMTQLGGVTGVGGMKATIAKLTDQEYDELEAVDLKSKDADKKRKEISDRYNKARLDEVDKYQTTLAAESAMFDIKAKPGYRKEDEQDINQDIKDRPFKLPILTTQDSASRSSDLDKYDALSPKTPSKEWIDKWDVRNLPGQRDQSGQKEILDAAALNAKEIARAQNDMMTNFSLTGRKEDLELAKSNQEDAKKQAEDWYKNAEDVMAIRKASQVVTAAQEEEFWSRLAQIASGKGKAFQDVDREIWMKVGTLNQEVTRKTYADELKAFQDHIKEMEEASLETGGNPALTRLKALQAAIAHPTANTEQTKWVQTELPGAQKAAFEAYQTSLKRMVTDTDVAFAELGHRNAEELVAMADNNIALLKMLGGSVEAIEEQEKKRAEALKKSQEENDKVQNLTIQGRQQSDTGQLALQKQQAEIAYASQRVHSYQQEVDYVNIIGALELKELENKKQAAEEELKLAQAENDRAKIREAQNKLDAANLDIQKQILQIQLQQVRLDAEHIATLKQGLNAFISDANKEMKLPGEILRDGLKSALDQTSDQLVHLMNGQKTSWKKMFEEIGQQMQKEAIKSTMEKGLAKLAGTALGKKLGLKDPNATIGHSSTNPWYVKNVDGQGSGTTTQPGGTGPGGIYQDKPATVDGYPRLPDGLIDRTPEPIENSQEETGNLWAAVPSAQLKPGIQQKGDPNAFWRPFLHPEEYNSNADFDWNDKGSLPDTWKSLTTVPGLPSAPQPQAPPADIMKKLYEQVTSKINFGNQAAPQPGLLNPGTTQGTTPNNPIYVAPVGGKSAPKKTSSIFGSGGGLFGGGDEGGGIFSMLGGAGGAGDAASSGDEAVSSSISFGDIAEGFSAMANGGSVEPGQFYRTNDRADRQPEVFSPASSGSIIPIDQLKGGGNSYEYHIDNRGAELGSYNRLVQTIPAIHDAAVSNAMKASEQKRHRTPQRKQ